MRGIIAKRYAQALFSLGEDEGSEAAFGQAVADFAASVKAAGPEGEALSSLAYPKELRGQVLEAVLAKAECPRLVSDFFRLLHARGRLGLLAGIDAAYRKLLDDKAGLVRGEVTVAAPLEPSQLGALKAALSTFTGRHVELTVKEDPAIIGGVVAKLGDLALDGSLKSQFERLSRLIGAA
jgi:F-type H+-transporting ATPase subunit delta